MGMSDLQRMWNKADGQKAGGQPQSDTWSEPLVAGGHVAGSSSRPSVPKQNQAGLETPRFVAQGEGNSPISGTGNGQTDTWKPRSMK